MEIGEKTEIGRKERLWERELFVDGEGDQQYLQSTCKRIVQYVYGGFILCAHNSAANIAAPAIWRHTVCSRLKDRSASSY